HAVIQHEQGVETGQQLEIADQAENGADQARQHIGCAQGRKAAHRILCEQAGEEDNIQAEIKIDHHELDRTRAIHDVEKRVDAGNVAEDHQEQKRQDLQVYP